MDKAEATAARNFDAQREAEAQRPSKQRADRASLLDEQNAAQAQSAQISAQQATVINERTAANSLLHKV